MMEDSSLFGAQRRQCAPKACLQPTATRVFQEAASVSSLSIAETRIRRISDTPLTSSKSSSVGGTTARTMTKKPCQ
jgi:hypothetical protein